MLFMDPGRRPPTLLIREGDPKSVEPGCAVLRPVMAVEGFRSPPSPILKPDEIDTAEMKWKDIGSRIFAKTFKNISKVPVTLKGGPPECDMYRRAVRSFTTGKVIDDSVIDDMNDQVLRRSIPEPDNLRVELIMRTRRRAQTCLSFTLKPVSRRRRRFGSTEAPTSRRGGASSQDARPRNERAV